VSASGPRPGRKAANRQIATIPGRPPLHERSISAPGNSWKPHSLAEVMQLTSPMDENADKMAVPELRRSSTATPKQPLSPKQLAPLVIPTQNGPAPRLSKQPSLTRLRAGSTPVDPQIRSARADDSPKSRTPYTPMSAATSAVTASTLPTPVSAAATESRSSPKPWERPSITTPMSATTEFFVSPRTEGPRSANAVLYGHRRGVSESGSIMERGRPRKRLDVRNNNGPLLKATDLKRSKSQERKAFEELPKGWKMHEAVTVMSPTDVAALQKQAFGQATRFEVLKKEDVEALSRVCLVFSHTRPRLMAANNGQELRQLDERTEYLRRTYTSLRAGRRNLHSRICQYLRSPRVAKFSHDSMLKQEEALAELDASIDDWVAKLDQAENRRTRVRQKLLEHVAAAATLPTAAAAAASEQLQQAMGIRPPPPIGVGNISTPPRSPTKPAFSAPHTASNSPSPQRVVAQVPSTILELPLVEEAATLGSTSQTVASLRRADVESIRIYAGDDVYALLADVENEITKMSAAANLVDPPSISDSDRRMLHRARSHEMLSGMTKTTPTPPSPPAPSPPMKDTPPSSDSEGEIFLTNAVFRPAAPERANTTT
jgi:hypothetical protein